MGCLLHSSPIFFVDIFLFVGLTTLGTFIKFWLVSSLSWVFKCFTPLNVIYRRDNFVFNHWGCTSIHLLLTYPWCLCQYLHALSPKVCVCIFVTTHDCLFIHFISALATWRTDLTTRTERPTDLPIRTDRPWDLDKHTNIHTQKEFILFTTFFCFFPFFPKPAFFLFFIASVANLPFFCPGSLFSSFPGILGPKDS